MGNFEKLGILVIIVLVVVIIVVAAWGVRPGARSEPLTAQVLGTDSSGGHAPAVDPEDGDRDGSTGGQRRSIQPDPPPPPPPPPPPAERTYTVQPRDSLWLIAQKMYGKGKEELWRGIAKANPSVDPDGLKVGTTLKIPAVEAPSGPASPPSPGPGPDSSGLRIYRIQPGDSLWMIAKNELGNPTRYKEILQLNPDVDPDRLPRNGTLKLPAR